MIIRKHLDPRVIIRVSWRRMLTLFLISLAVYMLYEQFGNRSIAISTLPASILGIAIAFLVGFRVNSAYERWWEARRVWGAMVNDSRSFARQVLTLTGPGRDVDPDWIMFVQQQLIYGQIGFVYAVKRHLRRQNVLEESRTFFTPEELEALEKQQNIPNAILLLQARKLRELLGKGCIDDFRHMQIDFKISALCDSFGACERIKNTVFPRQYSYYSTLFVRIYSYILPFVLVQETGVLIIPFTLIIGFIFFALDSIANGIENPFENSFNDTPMSAISRTIEINLREMLDETELPEPVGPVNGFLF